MAKSWKSTGDFLFLISVTTVSPAVHPQRRYIFAEVPMAPDLTISQMETQASIRTPAGPLYQIRLKIWSCWR